MKWWAWALALLPAGVGILIAILAAYEVIPDPVLYLRGSLGALAILAGVTISLVVVAAAQWRRKARKVHQEEIEAVQRQSSEDRRRFLQRLDHELKNPLTAIQAGLTNLTYEPLENYQANELSAVQAQVLRISRMVADLRKLAALESRPLEAITVDMAELLTEVVSVVEERTTAGERQLNLSLPNAPWPLPKVMGDPDLLFLAIHNLLDNAVKFTCPGDTIEVRAFENGSYLGIEVADTGLGIAEDELDRVWEELYRGERARGIPGSGLGLPLTRAIIEGHGGSVGLRSRTEQGTVFSVRLPVK